MFEYSASARSRGLKDIGVGMALTGVCGGILAAIVFGADVAIAWWIVGIACLIFALAGVVFVLGGIARLVTGGVWHIRVHDEGISWRAPLVAESSFAYPLAEVSGIENRIRRKTRKDGSVKEKREFVLIAVDGTEHRLTHQSGIDIEAFVTACRSVGVALSEKVVPYRRRNDL